MSVQFTVVPTGSGTPTGNVEVSDGVDNCTGTVASGSCSISLTTGGARTLTAHYVGDANFNESTSAGVAHTVDAIPPDTTIDSNPPDPSTSGSASFTFSGTDAGTGLASFECKLDGGSFAACTSPKDYPGLADGSHTFQVRAIDGVGNVDPTPDSFTWTIDTTAPDTTIDSQPVEPEQRAARRRSRFSGTDAGTGVASFECKLDARQLRGLHEPEGLHGPGRRQPHLPGARDRRRSAMSTRRRPRSRGRSTRRRPTRRSTAIPRTRATRARRASASAAPTPGTGVASFECKLDGGSFAACTSPKDYSGLSDGSHTFQVRAIDGAGNVDPTPASFTWTIDATACTITGPAAGETLVGTSGADVICGAGGNDRLLGKGGADVLRGEDGNDALVGGAGADVFEGGAEQDTASMKDAAAVVVSIGDGANDGSAGEGDDVQSDVERGAGQRSR